MSFRPRRDAARRLARLAQPVVADVAERIAAHARATAPVDTGEYRDSIRATEDGRVESATDHTLIVEAQTNNLARALEAQRRR